MILNIIILILLGMIIYYLTSQSCDIDEFKNTIQQENLNNVQQSIISQSKPPLQKVFEPTSSQQNTLELPTISEIPNKPDIYLNQDNNPLISYTGIEDNLINNADFNNAFTVQNEDKNNVIDFNKYNIDKYNVKDYLPKDVHNDWFDVDFSQARHNIDDNNLINPDRFCIGINTVGQSLKNPSWDIRGSVPCPKYSISPWNNSTFEPDYNIKP